MNAFWFLVIVWSIGIVGYWIWDIDQWGGSTGPMHWLWVTIRTIGYVLGIIFTLGLILAFMSYNKERN